MFLHVKYIKNDNDLLCYSCLLIRYWTLCGALFAGLFWINSSSFDFARREWVEKSSGHFLQRRELNQRTSCQHGVCRRPASVWSDAVCRCHVYLICTDSKRMFGRTSINTFFFFFNADFVLLLKYFSSCMCATVRQEMQKEGLENSGSWEVFLNVIFTSWTFNTKRCSGGENKLTPHVVLICVDGDDSLKKKKTSRKCLWDFILPTFILVF